MQRMLALGDGLLIMVIKAHYGIELNVEVFTEASKIGRFTRSNFDHRLLIALEGQHVRFQPQPKSSSISEIAPVFHSKY